MNEEDRELLMLLGSVGIRLGEVVTGLFEDDLSHDEQIAFGYQLVELAEGFRQRALRAPIVVDGDLTRIGVEPSLKQHRSGGFFLTDIVMTDIRSGGGGVTQ